jgi:hypothetical protein
MAFEHNEPVAWLVFADDGGESVYVTLLKETAEAAERDYGRDIAPLYRSPALTDEEREAIRWAEREAQAFAEIEMRGSSHGEALAATLRGLLERTK